MSMTYGPDPVLAFTCYLNLSFRQTPEGSIIVTFFFTSEGAEVLERLKILPRVTELGKGAVGSQDSRSVCSAA